MKTIISEPCSGGSYLDQDAGCTACETGTFSPGDTTSSCINCPANKTSGPGAASQETDCTWGESMFYL